MAADYLERLRLWLDQRAMADEGVEAARNACVAGASLASAAITAAAWYDNPITGSRAVVLAMRQLCELELDRNAWVEHLLDGSGGSSTAVGFGFTTAAQQEAIGVGLLAFRAAGSPSRVAFYAAHKSEFDSISGGLNCAGFCALVFLDLCRSSSDAEVDYLCWRIERALRVVQLNKKGLGGVSSLAGIYEYVGPQLPAKPLDLEGLLEEVGLD